MDYPRMLFPDGDPTAKYRIVANEDEDAAARSEGYREAYSAAPEEAPAPRSRSPKAA